MGTREVCEEKLRRGNLHHDPTISQGLGSACCPRCLSLLNPDSGNREWTITSALHDATAVAGSGLGGLVSAVFLQIFSSIFLCILSVFPFLIISGIPYLQNRIRGPKWLPFVVVLPPLLLFSGVGSAFGGYALPKFAQVMSEWQATTCKFLYKKWRWKLELIEEEVRQHVLWIQKRHSALSRVFAVLG